MGYEIEFVTAFCAVFFLFCLPALDANYYSFLAGSICLLVPALLAICRGLLLPTYIWVTESDSMLAHFLRDSKVLLLLVLLLFFSIPWLYDNLEDGPLPVAPDISIGDTAAPTACDDTPLPTPVSAPSTTPLSTVTKLSIPPPPPFTTLPTPPPSPVTTLTTAPTHPLCALPTPPSYSKPEGSPGSPATDAGAPCTPGSGESGSPATDTEDDISPGSKSTWSIARQSHPREQRDGTRGVKYIGFTSASPSETTNLAHIHHRQPIDWAKARANAPAKYIPRRLKMRKTEFAVPESDTDTSSNNEPKKSEPSPPTVEPLPENCTPDVTPQAPISCGEDNIGLGIDTEIDAITVPSTHIVREAPAADLSDQPVLHQCGEDAIIELANDVSVGTSDVWETPAFPTAASVDDMSSGVDELACPHVPTQGDGDVDIQLVEDAINPDLITGDDRALSNTDVHVSVDFGDDKQSSTGVLDQHIAYRGDEYTINEPVEDTTVGIPDVQDVPAPLSPDVVTDTNMEFDWQSLADWIQQSIPPGDGMDGVTAPADDMMGDLSIALNEVELQSSTGIADNSSPLDEATEATTEPVDDVMGELPDIWDGAEDEWDSMMDEPYLPGAAGARDASAEPVDDDMGEFPDMFDFLAEDAKYFSTMDQTPYPNQALLSPYGPLDWPAALIRAHDSNPYDPYVSPAPEHSTAQPAAGGDPQQFDTQRYSAHETCPYDVQSYPGYDPFESSPQPYPALTSPNFVKQPYPALNPNDSAKQHSDTHDQSDLKEQPSDAHDPYKNLYKSNTPSYTVYNPSDFGKQPHGPYNPFESSMKSHFANNQSNHGGRPNSTDEQPTDSGNDSGYDSTRSDKSDVPDTVIDPVLLARSPTHDGDVPTYDVPKNKGKKRQSDDDTHREVGGSYDNQFMQIQQDISPQSSKRRSIKELKKTSNNEDRSEVAQFAAGAPKYDISKLDPSMLAAYKGVKRRDSSDDAGEAGDDQPAKRPHRDDSDSSKVVLDPMFPTETFWPLETLSIADAIELISKWLMAIQEKTDPAFQSVLKTEDFLTIYQRLTQIEKYATDSRERCDGKVDDAVRDVCVGGEHWWYLQRQLIGIQKRTDLSDMAKEPTKAFSALNRALKV